MALRNFDVFWLDLDVFLFQSPTAAVAKVTAAVANVELLISGAFAATLLYQLFFGMTDPWDERYIYLLKSGDEDFLFLLSSEKEFFY